LLPILLPGRLPASAEHWTITTDERERILVRIISNEDARPGSRNGYREVTVKTTAGPVTLARPKLRGTTEAFASRLFGSHVTKTNALETLVIASFVRGLSVRDVEAALAEAQGGAAAAAGPAPPLLDPPRQLRTRTVTATGDDEHPENVSAIG
jgi:Transposase, Mutator family